MTNQSTVSATSGRRQWLHFSLRTLLIVITLATVTFGGWVQFMRQRARKNRERVAAVEKAADEIEKLGGTVYMIEVWEDYKAYKDDEGPRSQTWLEKQFDDPGGADDPVGGLKFTTVDLNNDLNDTIVEHLTRLTHFRELSLVGPNVTDAGLEHLKGLTKLKELHVDATNITDAGLKHLKGLTNLETLRLFNTQVTDDGVKKLQQALPKCQIRSADVEPVYPIGFKK